MRAKPYRKLIGALIYLTNTTRPDISFAVSKLSRYCSNPGKIHWIAAKRVLRYLKGTANYGILYEKRNQKIHAYTDSDWAGDTEDRKSCSGYAVMFAGGPISWESKKQKSVALSTMEAEYIGLSEAVKEVIYLRKFFVEIGLEEFVEGPTTILCDNQSAVHLTEDNISHGKSKHIDIRHHFSREAKQQGEIDVNYLSTDEMVADVLTKALPKAKHQKCTGLLRLNIQIVKAR